MTSQEKKQWLQKYRDIESIIARTDKRINAKFMQIEQLRSLAERTTSVLTGMPHGGGYKSRDDIYIKLADLGNEVNEDIDDYVDDKRIAEKLQNEIMLTISAIEDVTLQKLLWLRYIDGCTFEQIACDMNYCIMHIWRLHGQALQKLKIEKSRYEMLC